MTIYRLITRLVLPFILACALLLTLAVAVKADTGIDGGTNAYRNANGLASLPTSGTLASLASQRAQEIYSDFSHNFSWWGASGCKGIGENLVYRVPAPSDPSGYSVQAWIDSPAHRANLLGDWDVMGSAVYVGADGGMYAVQLFGKDCGLDPQPVQPFEQKPVPAPVVPVSDPSVGQPTQPAVVEPSIHLPNTSMETP